MENITEREIWQAAVGFTASATILLSMLLVSSFAKMALVALAATAAYLLYSFGVDGTIAEIQRVAATAMAVLPIAFLIGASAGLKAALLISAMVRRR